METRWELDGKYFLSKIQRHKSKRKKMSGYDSNKMKNFQIMKNTIDKKKSNWYKKTHAT